MVKNIPSLVTAATLAATLGTAAPASATPHHHSHANTQQHNPLSASLHFNLYKEALAEMTGGTTLNPVARLEFKKIDDAIYAFTNAADIGIETYNKSNNREEVFQPIIYGMDPNTPEYIKLSTAITHINTLAPDMQAKILGRIFYKLASNYDSTEEIPISGEILNITLSVCPQIKDMQFVYSKDGLKGTYIDVLKNGMAMGNSDYDIVSDEVRKYVTPDPRMTDTTNHRTFTAKLTEEQSKAAKPVTFKS